MSKGLLSPTSFVIEHTFVTFVLMTDVTTEDQGNDGKAQLIDDEEPSMLDTLSSEQLARRPSFK